jgi:4-hydroxybenzoate polyprenyltransferase
VSDRGPPSQSAIRGDSYTTALGLLRACHLPPAVAVTALVTALAAENGRGAAGCVLVALAALAGQLSVGWCNDAVDAGRDIAVGRRDKPIATGMVGVRATSNAATVAVLLCVPLSFASGLAAGALHLVAVSAAWAYNLGLKATVVSWLPYAVAFAILPTFVTLGLPGHPPPVWWAVLAAALIGCGAHLANVLPDIAADLTTGVRGWPQRLGVARVRFLIPLPLLAASVLLVLGPAGRPGALAWTALVVAAALAAGGPLVGARLPRVPFATAIAVAAVDVALLLAGGTGITGR